MSVNMEDVKVGDKLLFRNGQTLEVTEISKSSKLSSVLPFFIKTRVHYDCVTSDGFASTFEVQPWDIVEHFPAQPEAPQLTFVTGRSYKTRDGRKVTLLKTDVKNKYPIVGIITQSDGSERHCTWHEDGHLFAVEQDVLDGADLVAEWHEPVNRIVDIIEFREGQLEFQDNVTCGDVDTLEKVKRRFKAQLIEITEETK